MYTSKYYQFDDETAVTFVPFKEQREKRKLCNLSIFRNMFIVSCLLAGALIIYTTTSQTKMPAMKLDSILKYSDLDDTSILHLFEEFKISYNKLYSFEEEALRYKNFCNFLHLIDERNGNDSFAVHGITKFADLSKAEFSQIALGYIPSSTSNKRENTLDLSYNGNYTYINWADIYTTSVKDQGYWGSCWAFSATEQIESDAIRLGLLTTNDPLSVEQIVQCDTTDYGCGGGNTETAFEYVKNAGGIESETQYPYTSYYDVTGDCVSSSKNFVVTVDNYYSLSDEDSMISHIFSTGPISVCLDASSWSSYVSGIITTCGMDVDHCVQAVGINMEDGYWIVRNSWGTEWGNEGYIWLQAGNNMCNIAYDPTYVDVSKK